MLCQAWLAFDLNSHSHTPSRTSDDRGLSTVDPYRLFRLIVLFPFLRCSSFKSYR